MSHAFQNGHEIWGSVAGDTLHDIGRQTEALMRWGVHAIEFRFDLIPKVLWGLLAREMELPVEWWAVHFGTGAEANAAHAALRLATISQASGCALHSRCNGLLEARHACSEAAKAFAVPYHSRQPLSEDEALAEYEYQARLEPHFRKIAVCADNALAAASILRATARAAAEGRGGVVGAVYGAERWARIALPAAGSAITFVVAARRASSGIQEGYQQFDIAEIQTLLRIRGLFPLCRQRAPRPGWVWTLARPESRAS